MDRPILFLDVDGVLNAFDEEGINTEHMTEGFQVFVPPNTKENVQKLLEVFDPVWATAWMGSAHRGWKDILELDGFPWPYISYNMFKLTEIIKFAGDRKWAWVDDDIQFELDGLEWTKNHVQGLLIEPDPNTGLTSEHVATLVEWANSGS